MDEDDVTSAVPTTRHARPYRSLSQATHFLADPEFDTMQTEHIHPPVFSGFFRPAAAQSKPTFVSVFTAPAPGRGASHTAHFSFTESGFCSMHVEQVQLPADGATGFAMPAADQSNPVFGGASGVDPGRRASQMVHFSLAESGLSSIHSLHFHVPADAEEGFFIPAAAQSNPAFVEELEAAAGLGASHIVHFSFADSGLFSMHSWHVHPFEGATGFLIPAAPQSKEAAAFDASKAGPETVKS